MGIAIGVGIGFIINIVLLYCVMRNFFIGNKKLSYAYLSIVFLFALAGLNIYLFDKDTDLLTCFGLAPFYFFRFFTLISESLLIVVVTGIFVLSLPFVLVFILSKNNKNKITNNSSKKVHYTHLFELTIGGVILVLFVVGLWNFWLSPQNFNSPFLLRYTIDSQPTFFYKDWGGNVYTFLQLGSGDNSYYRRFDIPTTADDFQVLSRNWATSSKNIFYSVNKNGGVSDVSHLDTRTFRVIGGNDEYVSDKNGVYFQVYNKVSGVKYPDKFRPLEAALKFPICFSYNEYTCEWYQDDTSVYYNGSLILSADANNFKLIDLERGYDKKYNYIVDLNKIVKPKESNCTSSPCLNMIGSSDISSSLVSNSDKIDFR